MAVEHGEDQDASRFDSIDDPVWESPGVDTPGAFVDLPSKERVVAHECQHGLDTKQELVSEACSLALIPGVRGAEILLRVLPELERVFQRLARTRRRTLCHGEVASGAASCA